MAYYHIVDPTHLGYRKKNIEQWRSMIKWQRGMICEEGGEGDITCHLHECIVTRRDGQGLPDAKKLRLFSNCNMVVLCPVCHKKAHGQKDSREIWFARMCERYGEKEMREWYAGFGWKSPETRFMPVDTRKE